MNMQALVNTTVYTPVHLCLIVSSGLAWTVAFGAVFRNIRRHGVVEIPPAAIAANCAWATVWAFMYRTDLGAAFVWSLRVWWLLSAALLVYAITDGARHVRIPEVRRWFRPGMIVSYACWLAMLGFFAQQNYDLPTGMLSCYVVTLLMSVLYVAVELSDIDAQQYSIVMAWAKATGNSLAFLFCILVYPDKHFLLTLGALTLVLDVLYLLLFRYRQRVAAAPVPAPA